MRRPGLEQLDPRSRMMLMLCLSTLGVVWQNPFYLALVCIATFSILAIGRADWRQTIMGAKSIFSLIVLLFMIQCLFVRQGNVLWAINNLTLVTEQGLLSGLSVGLRLLVIVLTVMIVITGELRDYLQGLIRCKVPYEIAFMVMVSLHFLPILHEEAENTYHGIQLRGTELKNTTLKQKGSIYISMLLPIISGALQRAKAMSIAMEARAFRLYSGRTYLRGMVLSPQDKIILVLVPVLTMILLVITL